MSTIKVTKSSMVCPAQETPKGSMWLSKLDMMIRTPYSHTKVLYLYSPLETSSNFFNTNILKEALSRVLVPFYPMAGRLMFNIENGRYEIDCNAKGALFVEAESMHALEDFGDYLRPGSKLMKEVFPECDYSRGLSLFPLLLVQFTRFKCGSVCFGFAQHHHVGDGASQLHFNNSWARLAKGLDLGVHPIHDRATYLAPRDPPQVRFRHIEYEPSLPPKSLSGEIVTATECIFKLAKDQVNAIKLQATSQEVADYKFSTFEVQAGHVWRSVCMARELPDDQDVKLYIPVEGRSRLQKMGVPKGYCGNILFFTACVEKAGDIMGKPLWYAASKVHEAIKKMNDLEYLRSAIDFVESHPDLTAIVRGPQTSICPNLTINSWARLPCYEADFGWGGPKFIGISGINYDGQSYITPSSNGDGSFSVAIKLFTPHMTMFKKYFYNI